MLLQRDVVARDPRQPEQRPRHLAARPLGLRRSVRLGFGRLDRRRLDPHRLRLGLPVEPLGFPQRQIGEAPQHADMLFRAILIRRPRNHGKRLRRHPGGVLRGRVARRQVGRSFLHKMQ
jgi:hypothetical protein